MHLLHLSSRCVDVAIVVFSQQSGAGIAFFILHGFVAFVVKVVEHGPDVLADVVLGLRADGDRRVVEIGGGHGEGVDHNFWNG